MKLMIISAILALLLLTQVIATVPLSEDGTDVSEESEDMDNMLQTAVKRRYKTCQGYKSHCNGKFTCCSKYTCRCNVTGTYCKCERRGLFYRWGK